MGWLTEYWQWILIAFYVLEKVVKISPAAWDDILVDGIKTIVTKLYNLISRP